MINVSPYKPEEVEISIRLGQRERTINFDVTEDVINGIPQYSYRSAKLPLGVWTYEAIVSALVNELYPADRMQAIQNNYLDSPDDAHVADEFNEMQNWRREAKAIAKELLAKY